MSILTDANETSTGRQRRKVKRNWLMKAYVGTGVLLKHNNKIKAKIFF